MYYSKIDNSVSSPHLGYHCLFVNILLYVIVFGYVCLLNCLYVFFFNCSLIDDRSLFGLYLNKNYLLTYLHLFDIKFTYIHLFFFFTYLHFFYIQCIDICFYIFTIILTYIHTTRLLLSVSMNKL
jgi:hypothetical protein